MTSSVKGTQKADRRMKIIILMGNELTQKRFEVLYASYEV